MNTDIIKTEQEADIAQGARKVVENVKAKANENYEAAEERVRQSPGKAIAIALGSGYILNKLPIAALFAVPIRLTAILAKPTLLILGAAKLYDIVEKQSRK